MNHLSLRREYYEGVSNLPHFLVGIDYEGCQICFDDIYFDEPSALARELQILERCRNGQVALDGGSRFRLTVSVERGGELLCRFRAEPNDFPGKLQLEGFFSIDGEFTGMALHALIRLLSEGCPLTLHAGFCG